MVKKLSGLTGGKRMFEVFRDFTEMFALTLRNVVDPRDWQKREDRYLEVAKGYTSDQLTIMAEVFAMVVTQMEHQPEDVLGKLYMELEIGNDARGQFFTPYEIAKLMATLQADEIASRGDEHVSIYEPACGAGAFMIAISQELRERNREFHVTAEDVDPVAVHMAYIQFTILDIPAIVYHRDTLTQETYDAWPTMAHVRGLWKYRLRRGSKPVDMPAVQNDATPAPMPTETSNKTQPVPMPLIDVSEGEQGAFDFVVEGA
jgi:hypothetical protein